MNSSTYNRPDYANVCYPGLDLAHANERADCPQTALEIYRRVLEREPDNRRANSGVKRLEAQQDSGRPGRLGRLYRKGEKT